MNKSDLIDSIAERTGFTKKDCGLFIDVFCSVVSETLVNGGRVLISNFGVFEVRKSKARVGKNFFENSTHPIPPRKVPYFTPGRGLREAVMEARSDD